MLQQLWEYCTSSNAIYWLVVGSDLAIATAYFAIPITMAVVLRDRKQDIPYPWLWLLFVTFIVACGLTWPMPGRRSRGLNISGSTR